MDIDLRINRLYVKKRIGKLSEDLEISNGVF
jgi:hypothetical protein